MKLEAFKNIFLSEQEKIQQERLKEWGELEKQIKEFGADFEEKIKLPVLALWAHKFPTYESCQGHLGRERAVETVPRIYIGRHIRYINTFPQFYADFDHRLSKEEEKERLLAIEEENKKHRIRFQSLLEEFYKNVENKELGKLTVGEEFHNAFILKSESLDTPENPDIALENRQRLINEFGSFLKEKFLNPQIEQ